jgi:hypothetical protein
MSELNGSAPIFIEALGNGEKTNIQLVIRPVTTASTQNNRRCKKIQSIHSV